MLDFEIIVNNPLVPEILVGIPSLCFMKWGGWNLKLVPLILVEGCGHCWSYPHCHIPYYISHSHVPFSLSNWLPSENQSKVSFFDGWKHKKNYHFQWNFFIFGEVWRRKFAKYQNKKDLKMHHILMISKIVCIPILSFPTSDLSFSI